MSYNLTRKSSLVFRGPVTGKYRWPDARATVSSSVRPAIFSSYLKYWQPASGIFARYIYVSIEIRMAINVAVADIPATPMRLTRKTPMKNLVLIMTTKCSTYQGRSLSTRVAGQKERYSVFYVIKLAYSHSIVALAMSHIRSGG